MVDFALKNYHFQNFSPVLVGKMRQIAKVKNAVTRVSDTALLARFKPGHELKKPQPTKSPAALQAEEVSCITC